MRSMFTWLALGALYLLVIGLFRWLGGVAAAADAIARWGRAAAAGSGPGRPGEHSAPDSPGGRTDRSHDGESVLCRCLRS
jgi:hypothetical protein